MKMKAMPSSRLSLARSVDHLRLNRDVQRGDRLVGDDQLRLQRQRAGDGDPLALAAGELVGVALGVLRREAHLRQQLGHALAPLRLRQDVGVDHPGLGDDLVDRHARIERLRRILEHHLDLAAHGVELARRHREEVAALPECAPPIRLDQSQNCLGDRRLARAALADDGEHLALLQLEAHVVERLEGAVVLASALDLQDRLGTLRRRVHLAAAGSGGDQFPGVGVLGVMVDFARGAAMAACQAGN